jgi:outer membrane protein assembly factor BamB
MLMAQRFFRYAMAAFLIAGALLLRTDFAVTTRASATLDDWPMFLHDVSRSSFNPQESRLSAGNAGNLHVKWKFETPGVLVAQPVVVGDLVYIGGWDGVLYAVDRESGTLRWQVDLGTTTGPPHCFPANAGITSAPHVIGGVLYIGGGDNYKYAIDANTGIPLWRFDVGDNSAQGGAYNWDSPAVFNGKVYTGISSFCDHPFVQGKLWALDASTGTATKEVSFVGDGQLGGGIWTSPTIDPSTGAVYVTTGSGDAVIDDAYAIAVCDPNTLAVLSAWQIPDEEQVTDGDWGTTPTLFKHKDGRTLVGAAAKNGFYYTFDANRIGDGPIWKYRIAIPGGCPTCGEGSISSSAYAYQTLYTAGGRTSVNGEEVGGAVRAMDPSTGQVLWEHATAGSVFGSLAVANNLVVVAADKELIVLDAHTGANLWSYDMGATMYGAPSVAGGVVYAANTDGALYAFTAGPYDEPSPTPSPLPATPGPAAATPQPAPPLPGQTQCFAQTGKCIRGVFLDYWKQNGGLERFGYPITGELLADGRVVQYTQRARFEQHAEDKPPYDVLLGRLGIELSGARGSEPAFRKTSPASAQSFVPETGHNIGGSILKYWQANGGIPVFGYPLSEAFYERSPTDGQTYQVQYFERQRLEYHPEIANPKFQVLLGLLGVQAYTLKFGASP